MTTSKDHKYAHLFKTEGVNRDVGKKSVRAGYASLSSQGMSMGITLVRAAVLARLLTPEDYGVFTMVVVVSSFAIIFKDLGLSTATVREKHITHAQVSNLFWINTLFGVISMIVVWAASPAIVWFYQDTRLAAIALVLSIGFLFGGLTVQHQALLKRQMQFGKIALITVLSAIASSILGVITAWYFGNYWALVWMQVSHNLFFMIGFWLATKWIPGLPTKKAGTKKFIRFGLDVAGLKAFSTVAGQVDKLIIGRISDAVTLGLYNKGQQVPQMIGNKFRLAFFAVALSALSAQQDEDERFAEYYYKFLAIVSWTTMILSAFCFVFAEEIIHIYFGPKWLDSVIFMQIFSIRAFLMSAITTMDQIPLALGYSRRYLYAGLCRRIALVGSISIIAPFYGTIGIALCMAFSDVIAFIPFSILCLKRTPVTLKKFWRTITPPFIVSILLAVIFYIFKSNPTVQGVGYTLVFMSTFLLGAALLFLSCDFLKIGSTTGIGSTIIQKMNFRGKA